ncbi:uncharacterized protein [Rutidosis leptorrhynchoides]|uniref:uncharacterized protein n=1 Tax=Rutidosis leptorrhynchoides TaxID=125765 RepID=UPI003A991C82
MKPLREYLELGILPEDKKEARKIRIKAPSYKIMNGALYRKSFLTPWLRCVGPNQASIIIREMHEGICGLHAGPRSIVAKILRMGYYWPTMHEDTVTLLRICESCQIHAKVQKQLKQEMISVLSAWPFSKWGIDLVGPLTEAPGGFCEKLQIKQTFTTVYHPQGNGQVEVTNRDILKGLEKRLVLPSEIQVLTNRTANLEANEENLCLNLDLMEERREAALIREAAY